MTLQFNLSLRNHLIDWTELFIGNSPWLDIRTGAQPSTPINVDTGTELLHIQLPSDWLNPSSGGAKTKKGTWSGIAIADGTAAHFRIKDESDPSNYAYMQGSISATDGGGDMELSKVALVTDEVFEMTTFTLTVGNP